MPRCRSSRYSMRLRPPALPFGRSTQATDTASPTARSRQSSVPANEVSRRRRALIQVGKPGGQPVCPRSCRAHRRAMPESERSVTSRSGGADN